MTLSGVRLAASLIVLLTAGHWRVTHRHRARVYVVNRFPAGMDQIDAAVDPAGASGAVIHGGCKQIHIAENMGSRRQRSARNNDVQFSGGSITIEVTTQAACTWTAASNATWVTLATPENGSGGGRVELTVSENTGAARAGTLLIAGQTVSVNQQGRPCAYIISPGSYSSSSTGGTVSVTVTTTAGCEWTVTGNPTWVSANPTKNNQGNRRLHAGILPCIRDRECLVDTDRLRA